MLIDIEGKHRNGKTNDRCEVPLNDWECQRPYYLQSMSDEDSFKGCTDVEDAKCRISRLLDSLIKRSVENCHCLLLHLFAK